MRLSVLVFLIALLGLVGLAPVAPRDSFLTPGFVEAAPALRALPSLPLHSGQHVGVTPTADGLTVDGSLGEIAAYAPFQHVGMLVSEPIDLAEPHIAIRARPLGVIPPEARVEVEVRGSIQSTHWTEWLPVHDTPATFGAPVRFVQYRVTLLGMAEAPLVQAVVLEGRQSPGLMTALQAKTSPTLKVFGSREGLIGHKTANGHTITPTDRFVALPSRKALNPLGGTDYRVRVTYQDRSVELPVWDVGPWNVKDNYWDASREAFSDLPRFVPQAFAAWADNYNGGRDGSGRWVSFPAAIDISDAAFLEDLKLRGSSWVDVTFLWVDAASPPPGPTPAITGLKPMGSKGMQPGLLPPGSTGGGAAPEPRSTGSTSGAGASTGNQPVSIQRPHSLYHAYVAVDNGVDSWIVLQNPGDQPANALLQFTRVDGQRDSRPVTVPPGARSAVSASALVGLGEFSLEISSDRPIAAERSMVLPRDASTSPAVMAPSRTWFFAEGSTEEPLETLIALSNPTVRDTRATLIFFGDQGQLQSVDVRIARGARTVVNLAELLPPGGVATVVESDQPIIAERLTYAMGRTAGDAAIGSVAASTTWAFSDANTTAGSNAWLIMLNPSDVDASVMARFAGTRGVQAERTYTVPGRSRAAIHLNQELPESRFGLALVADQPIVAERSEFLVDESGQIAIVSVPGTIDAGTTWAFPEGASSSPRSATVSVFNPHNAAVVAKIDLYGEKGSVATRELRVAALSVASLELSGSLVESPLATRVTADRPVFVERQIRNAPGRGASASTGIRI